jgi:hypothetical protein
MAKRCRVATKSLFTIKTMKWKGGEGGIIVSILQPMILCFKIQSNFREEVIS